MSTYDKDLKRMLDTYARSASEREDICKTAVNVLRAYAMLPQSELEVPASVPPESETT